MTLAVEQHESVRTQFEYRIQACAAFGDSELGLNALRDIGLHTDVVVGITVSVLGEQ